MLPFRRNRGTQRLVSILRDPLGAAVKRRARHEPTGWARRHARLARRAGLDRAYLILSFDCDTAADADAARELHARLGALGVVPAYAVPGALLEQAADVYRHIAETGAEFLNHGGVEHMYFDETFGRQMSCFFYDELEPARVKQDIEEGHRLVLEIIGRQPSGFRAPHFGTYQRADQLRFMHDILRNLGYRYSTSTGPRLGFRHGPVIEGFPLPEVPVTGVPSAPFEIFDTWGYFAAPDRTREPVDYERDARIMASAVGRQGCGLINIYGDPSHVASSPEFVSAIESLLAVAEPISYGALLDRIGA